VSGPAAVVVYWCTMSKQSGHAPPSTCGTTPASARSTKLRRTPPDRALHSFPHCLLIVYVYPYTFAASSFMVLQCIPFQLNKGTFEG